MTTSTINVGGDNSKTFIGGTLEVSGNMIAGIDEDKEIFTDVSTNRITIGGGSSTVIVGGDLRVNTNILSQEGVVRMKTNIFGRMYQVAIFIWEVVKVLYG